MQELTSILSDEEKVTLALELEKLYELQDRQLPKKKLTNLIDELAATNLPMGALILGIRSLLVEDLKSIKLATIIDAAKGFLQGHVINGERERFPCEYCQAIGYVTLRDENRYEFTFACVCETGAYAHRSTGTKRWDGHEEMFSNGRKVVVPERFRKHVPGPVSQAAPEIDYKKQAGGEDDDAVPF